MDNTYSAIQKSSFGLIDGIQGSLGYNCSIIIAEVDAAVVLVVAAARPLVCIGGAVAHGEGSILRGNGSDSLALCGGEGRAGASMGNLEKDWQ